MDGNVGPCGGIWTTKDLTDEGLGQAAVRRLLVQGRLRRVRRGWYAEPAADPAVVRAVALGGALGCVSALGRAGVWVPPSPEVHVRTSRWREQAMPPGVLRCPPAGGPHIAPGRAVDPVELALRSAWLCQSDESMVALMDSVVHLGLLSTTQLEGILGPTARARGLVTRCDRAESGTESRVRLRLRARRIQLRPQVWVTPGDRVDLLVGERLVIEVDNRAHHTGEDNYRRDRDRDLRLRALGFIVVRLTYEQVMYRWGEVEPALLAMVRRGDQWWGARRAAA